MAKRTYEVEVKSIIKIELDDEKFTPEFVKEFNSTMFHCGDLDDKNSMLFDHAANIARYITQPNTWETFIDGYGELKEMGIKLLSESTEADPYDVLEVTNG